MTTQTISAKNAWVLAGLSGVLIISVFLPWFERSDDLASYSLTGLDESFTLIVPPIIAAGMAILVALQQIPLRGVVMIAAAGFIQALMVWNALSDIRERTNPEGGIPGDSANVGIGAWLAMFTAFALLAWALYALWKDKMPFRPTTA